MSGEEDGPLERRAFSAGIPSYPGNVAPPRLSQAAAVAGSLDPQPTSQAGRKANELAVPLPLTIEEEAHYMHTRLGHAGKFLL